MQNELVENLEEKTILLVDDDPFSVSSVDRVLKLLGMSNVERAENGQQALKVLERRNVDVLLTDIQMPTMNGLELIRQIRCGHSLAPQGLPVVIFTAFSTDQTLRSALELDVNGFLSKPVKPLHGIQKIIQALIEKEQRLRAVDDYALVNTDLEELLSGLSSDETGKNASVKADEQQVELYRLKPNMRLTRNVIHQNGGLLLSAGFLLQESTINRLKDLRPFLVDVTFYIEMTAETLTSLTTDLPEFGA